MARSQRKLLFNSYKVDSYLKERFLNKNWRQRRDYLWSEGCLRTINMARFCCVCSLSLIQVLAPWVLCTVEIITVLLIYFLATSRSLGLHEAVRKYHFSYFHSLEDVVGMACSRSVLLSIAYAAGMQHLHRPYLYTSYLLAAACFPYILVKTILFRYTRDAVPAAVLFVITSSFCWLHVFAARRTSDWARKRYLLGLGGGNFWDDEVLGAGAESAGSSGWGLMRRGGDLEDCTNKSDGGFKGSDDVAAESLADDDSKFLQVAGIQVHYKEVSPSTLGPGDEGCQLGIVLVHGFGAGVFAWRHIMEPLAMQCRCRVIAFDRPAFGLTSRPPVTPGSPNPYTIGFQSTLLLALCKSLGLTQILIASHADGCLLALRAASMSLRSLAESEDGLPPRLLAAHLGIGRMPSPCPSQNQEMQGSTNRPPTPSHLQPNQQPSFTVSEQPHHSQSTGLQHGTGLHPGQLVVAAAELVAVNSSHGGTNPHASVAPSPGALLETVAFPSPGSPGPGSCAVSETGAVLGYPTIPHAAGNAVYHHMPTTPHATNASIVTQWQSDGSHHHGIDAMAAAWLSPGVHTELGSSYQHPTDVTRSLAGHIAHDRQQEMFASTAGHHPNALAKHHGHIVYQGFAGVHSASSSVISNGSVLHVEAAHEGSTARMRTDTTRHRRVQSMPPASLMEGRLAIGSSTIAAGPMQVPEQMMLNGTLGSAHVAPLLQQLEEPHGPWPQVLGIAMLHPNLSGVLGPTLSRLLARSRLGRSILRPLLRSELGEVANRRAWHNTHKLTPEVLELYKAPLRVEGWCQSLIETTRVRREEAQGDLPCYLQDACYVPCMLLTGEFDRISPPPKVELLSAELPHSRVSVVPGCGHLSHEEAPTSLLSTLVPFCGSVIDRHAQSPEGMSASSEILAHQPTTNQA